MESMRDDLAVSDDGVGGCNFSVDSDRPGLERISLVVIVSTYPNHPN